MARSSRFLFPAGAACALAAACAGSPGGRAPEAARAGASNSANANASGVAAAAHGPAESDEDHRDPSRAPRALVFRAAGFPTVDAPVIDDGVLESALSGLPVDRAADVGELVSRLRLRDVDVLILPYGSAFPVEAWPRIRGFLRHGGGLAVLGGAPFHEPVRAEPGRNGAWLRGPRQTSFAHDLLIGPAEAVQRPAKGKTQLAIGVDADTGFTAPFPDAQTTWALTLRLTTEKDMPDEHGSSGPRDAVARPLVHVVDASGTPRGCPLLEIDHHRGDAAGARWLLATSDAKLDAPVVRAIVTRALEGASELRGQPIRAALQPGEEAQIRVTQRRFVVRHGEEPPARARVVVQDDRGRAVFSAEVALAGPP
ncbi:MAG: glycoside hydrolase, partial [Myxococcaceae bacterium]|nr:glycoside hydrolase [Myxococcaceae bacterium]